MNQFDKADFLVIVVEGTVGIYFNKSKITERSAPALIGENALKTNQ